ncbi:tRNA (adenosine(37)-N6)-threonylcarbamoyltransferase complex dimerization subunit type 1 TsaB [Candidatus Erwinia haradaeae]|uniref:tRNA threonylcarbamoyladenosine biosynthesis protein TsaB n=1 Tax=Candidatus Erwinia haradaeae TaxID=1922217 RepID=A0A451D3G1_9GAMM|nr:tRNA (adenosine(37)-N6)-threonylcarbamoyltransferase complex dimerization subunit type 1 TsaB [Candidatus Erwinia haradaeae]VFP80196.1 tRNA threonylcarbamoyladenosine biosynthesis protein TsaB [Candidatus Erwinia haradaeae]
MRILALDTTMTSCSVALLNKTEEFTSIEHCPHQHTQYILPLIQDILQKGKLSIQELDFLAFASGPGNFSGIRICLSITQGLSLGADIPLIAISTLQIIAQAAWRHQSAQRILVAIHAHIGKIYWAEYQRSRNGDWIGKNTESLLTPEEILTRMNHLTGRWTCVGTGWLVYSQLIKNNHLELEITKITTPHAKDILPLAKKKIYLKSTILARNAKPSYLRNNIC